VSDHTHSRAFTLIVVLAVVITVTSGSPVQASAFGWLCDPCFWGGAAVVVGTILFGSTIGTGTVAVDPYTPTDWGTDPCWAPPGQVSITLKPTLSELAPEETFDVAIYGDISTKIVSYGFHMSYDPSQLSLQGVWAAPEFQSLNASRPDGVAALAYPNPAIGDDVLLATARFTALTPGVAGISIEVTTGDPTEGFERSGCGYVTPTVTPTSVTIREPEPRPVPPVPEPATLLFLIGGASLLWRSRRRFG
jgi:hypothetical protein